MKIFFTLGLLSILSIVFIPSSYGQNQVKYKTFNQNDFDRNKVYNEVFSFWDKNQINWFSTSADSLKMDQFVDARNYKGIINYGVSFKSKTFRNFHFIENLSMCFLKVEFTKCNYNPKDNTVDIEGFVTGNDDWGSNVLIKTKKIKKYVAIFLGEKTDTIRNCYLGRTVNKDSVEVKFKNKETNELTLLDQFPAFYFKKYAYYKTNLGNKQPFKISGKVTPTTLLAFGASYSELFDLGAMIYNPTKNQRNKIVQRQDYNCVAVISNNKLVADIEKEKAQKQEINYYTYTQSAENYILSRQFAKAKEQYNLLNQKYPVLFARDIHNAIRCGILSRDFKTAFEWSEKLALKGIPLPYFNAKIFNNMRKNPQWKNFSIKYDSIRKVAENNWNLKLKKGLDDLLKEDQTDYGLENRKKPKELNETTERITTKFIDLLKTEGFPSEEKIGSFVTRDTTLVSFPDFNVVILHAMQQKPENLPELNQLLDKSANALEFDKKRSGTNNNQFDSCFRIYKGNLYSSKSCGRNDLEARKISFKFNNPDGFIMDSGNFAIEAHYSKNQQEVDDHYKENYNLIMKLTDDWNFYEK